MVEDAMIRAESARAREQAETCVEMQTSLIQEGASQGDGMNEAEALVAHCDHQTSDEWKNSNVRLGCYCYRCLEKFSS